jgi:hypothetical protein
MRYVNARADEQSREETYRIFVTESLRMLPQQKYIGKSYIELLKPVKVETRTGEQVADDVAKNLNTFVDWGR